mgnify:CR=1 FL=1
MTNSNDGEVFIVDNNDEKWKVRNYLLEWCDISRSFDIATGFFEIGGLLGLEEKWQKLEKIRILMGDEVSRRTMKAFQEGIVCITTKLDDSLEDEKRDNDFLDGVPAIVKALQDKKIECRVFRKKKFHAKAYITHSTLKVVGSSALVGSSNFTSPGLTQNVELNIQLRREVETLQKWFEDHWDKAEDVTPDILKTIERHTREFSPFEIYVKSLYEYFKGHELTESEWELRKSKVFPILDQYQKEGYQALMKIVSRYNGAFLCDGVGLGKTFIGLMLIERLLMKESKRVVLIVPKSARKPVWEAKLKKYLPEIMKGSSGGLIPFKIINHTDLLRRESGEVDWPGVMEGIKDQADVIIIDEAHHFRNRNSRYWQLYKMAEEKQMFLLTATPVNNTLLDLLHQIELFSRQEPAYFSDAPLGIHNLLWHFINLEKQIIYSLTGHEDDMGTPISDQDLKEVIAGDDLLKAIVVQRSRAYVKESQIANKGREVRFPKRNDPVVINYSLKKTYGKLLNDLKTAFDKNKPLLSLAMYYPLAHYTGSDPTIDPMEEGRQKQVVGLIRTLLLKRFESSKRAFEYSCEDLLLKLLAFVRIHDEKLCTRWENQHTNILSYIKEHQKKRERIDEEEAEEDYMPEELLESVEKLNPSEYDIAAIINETLLDMNTLSEFIKDLVDLKKEKDDKIENLITKLDDKELIDQNKVVIFTEYMHTARYILESLQSRIEFQKIEIDEIDGSTKEDRGQIIKRFSPYYNESTSEKLKEEKLKEIHILISTDVLSEGLNLQDATLLINYDLHWNPVRLMQRIGRIDRRLDDDVEKLILSDHPEFKYSRGKVSFWNFLPPEELNDILTLFEKVTKKTLRISKTFGIEGKKLLTPDDEYDALKEFNKGYEGETTMLEKMHLEYQKINEKNPELIEIIKQLPSKAFTGKEKDDNGFRGIFFCYSLPAKDVTTGEWTEDAGQTKWYLYTLPDEKILSNPPEIIEHIRSTPTTERKTIMRKDDLKAIRSKMDELVKDTYLKSVQAPIGVRPTLKTWMELN